MSTTTAHKTGNKPPFPTTTSALSRTTIYFTPSERLRILLFGRASISTNIHMEKAPGRTFTTASATVPTVKGAWEKAKQRIILRWKGK